MLSRRDPTPELTDWGGLLHDRFAMPEVPAGDEPPPSALNATWFDLLAGLKTTRYPSLSNHSKRRAMAMALYRFVILLSHFLHNP
ncbi:MAG: hypothetical protein QNJ78_07590 [Gammaproteobacteria bacterium]|nr:hypothetical protein [Gammaproteobacteria bacterium]